MEQNERLQWARRQAGYVGATEAARAFGWNENTYRSHENGERGLRSKIAEQYGRAFRVSPGWLLTGIGEPKGQNLVKVLGKVGATPDGSVRFAQGQGTGDFVPLPPGGTILSVALEVDGHSMRGYADNGSLIYFEDQKRPPTDDMIGEVVVVELDDGDVLVKRLFRGSGEGLFDLESIAGPRRTDARIVWAAHITAVIPPKKAREIIRRDLAA